MSSNKDSLGIGRNVIRVEADGLLALEKSLDQSFIKAVDLILASDQHLIVVGIGKSGHIGRKIAASFASMGTPAFFVHPSEAAHGDLGMITKGAVVLGLSNSGESAEVNGVIEYAKSLGNETLAITAGAQSTLAKCVDIALLLPDVPEACPNRLAPTTSTTLTLALGDALGVAVMEARGFTAEDFGRRHPAGKLGFGLKRVAEYLAGQSDAVPFISPNAEMADVILAITGGGKGCVAVVENQHLIGIVTDGDLRRAMGPDIMSQTAQMIMTKDPFTLSPEMRIKDAVTAFTERKIGNAFVLEGQEILGLIDLKTLLATGYV
ncbi:KpsF/GutQ family protein [Litorimonas cladophorae]|uniref:KpsF/GutQ family protein n=1 Tax=Litorimonas cladophorae TaxID=1220491 RepID=A0A918NAS7_9PROT|nr:KpsF/GutQ family sugar-phosphate isomerase [Litorimonas cladophorae]GGX59032.1 KpsF/GutQ family protein [Litorimonas cladophorae]